MPQPDAPLLHRPERSGLPPAILLVEDEPAEVYLLKKAFASGPCSVHVQSVPSVKEAFAFLHRQGPYGQAPRPQLIVTAIRLPPSSGFALLAELKGDPALRPIPVIVVSLYEAPEIIRKSYALGANSYLIKPRTLDALFAAIHALMAYWFTLATPAPPPAAPRAWDLM